MNVISELQSLERDCGSPARRHDTHPLISGEILYSHACNGGYSSAVLAEYVPMSVINVGLPSQSGRRHKITNPKAAHGQHVRASE